MSGQNCPANPPQMVLNEERKQFAAVMQNATASLGQLADTRPQEELFLTPISSPAYSTDGSSYASNELEYYPGTNGMPGFGQSIAAGLPPISTQQPYISAPDSPCDEYYVSSPYSSSYTASPASSHSPVPSCIANQYNFSMSPNTAISAPPCFTTSDASLPHFSNDTKPLSTCSNMPPPSGYYPSLTQPLWANQLSPFHEAFIPVNTLVYTQDEEIPIEMIEQPNVINTGGIDYYPLTPESPESQQTYYTPTPCSPYPKGRDHRRRQGQKKPPKPPIQVDDSDIKDIPTSSQLWEFTLRVIKKPKYQYMVSWENQKEGLFRFRDAQAFAALWGKHRNRPNMTYDKVARALRYYYRRDILNQVGGRLTYRFSKRLNKLYTDE